MIATALHLLLWGATERKLDWSHNESHTALEVLNMAFILKYLLTKWNIKTKQTRSLLSMCQ